MLALRRAACVVLVAVLPTDILLTAQAHNPQADRLAEALSRAASMNTSMR